MSACKLAGPQVPETHPSLILGWVSRLPLPTYTQNYFGGVTKDHRPPSPGVPPWLFSGGHPFALGSLVFRAGMLPSEGIWGEVEFKFSV